MHVKAVCMALTAIVTMVLIEPLSASSTSSWGQAERDLSLEIHNNFRRDEHGCHMNKLEYDMELEAQAKKWAEHCEFEHEMVDGRGENLAFNTRPLPEATLIKTASQAWFDEKFDYTWGQRSCSRSCHYTQLVWGTTEKVGCYTTRCDSLGPMSPRIPNSWYYVCFYTPIGNWNGETPYDKTCATKCEPGQTVEDGLCVGTPTGGASGSCKDTDPLSCQIWAQYDQCAANPSYMLKNCRKSCGVC